VIPKNKKIMTGTVNKILNKMERFERILRSLSVQM
jgi:hypothetical protein